jgi:hypothetical protein
VNAKMVITLGKAVVRAVKADLKNRYALERDWSFVVRDYIPASIHTRHLRMAATECGDGVVVTCFAPGCSNGATLVPDVPGSVEASFFHDAFDEDEQRIAAAWGWSRRKTRKWGDRVFGAIMARMARHEPTRAKQWTGAANAWLYLNGLRWLGGPGRAASRGLRKLGLAAVALAALAGGCAGGCAAPDPDLIELPDGPPAWRKTA